ncbi:hypothetical protein LL946_00075 [Knoellia locipacati]|uniref:hypothetical protein n=1 Tax=Knoellia locipacati TaxID=882824 RepID=UPI00384CF085
MSEHPNYAPQQPQGQWQPAYPPAPPVKQQNWFMRHKIITGILSLVVIGTIAGALGGGGNASDPVTIVEGKAFDIRKFAYAAGWKVTSNDFGMELANLKVTNNRGERDGAFVQIKYMKGGEVLATIDCTSDQILPGQTVTLSCFSTDKKPTGHDRITINDTF